MLIEVQTADGPRKVRVCDNCRAACIPSGRFCSGRCSRQYDEYEAIRERSKPATTPPATPRED